MCNTDEHVDIGDVAQLAVPKFLLERGKASGPRGYEKFLGWWKRHNQGKSNECFQLHNGAHVSYGDILAMTGDFYANYNDMDSSDQSPWDKLRKREEIDMITSLYRRLGKDPSARETALGARDPRDEKGDFFVHVALLATANYPHFAPDAITIWLKWHRKAIELAKAGREAVESGRYDDYYQVSQDKVDNPADSGGIDPSMDDWFKEAAAVDYGIGGGVQNGSRADWVLADSLLRAFKYNAFADHFLSDMWASGHMRVMRRLQKAYFDPGVIDFSSMLKSMLNNSTARTVGSGISVPGLSIKGLSLVQDLLAQVADHPGIDLGDITSGMLHDEDGNRGLWWRLLLGDLTLPGLEIDGEDDNDFVGPVGDVFALGDGNFYTHAAGVAGRGGDKLGKNVRNRKICYYAIRLSIRDICLASALGNEFETFRKSDDYWKPLGNDVGQKPLYAALRLYPKPNPPDGRFVRSYQGREAHKSNHYPLVAPAGDVSRLEKRYDAFKQMLLTGDAPALDEPCWLRKVEPVRFDPITVHGRTIQPPALPIGTGVTPKVSQPEEYWDLKAHWPDGKTPIDKLSDKDLKLDCIPVPEGPERLKKEALALRKRGREELRSAWRFLELGRIVGEYVDLKFVAHQHYDCDEP